MQRFCLFVVTTSLSLLTVAPQPGAAQTTSAPVPPVSNPCPVPPAGSVVGNPSSLFSSNGVLSVRFSYQHAFDSAGRELFCFMTPDGLQNPTLHVNPGDLLAITVTNSLPRGTGSMDVNARKCSELRRLVHEQLVAQYPLPRYERFTNLSSGRSNQDHYQSGQHVSVQRGFSRQRAAGTLLVPPACPRDSRACANRVERPGRLSSKASKTCSRLLADYASEF